MFQVLNAAGIEIGLMSEWGNTPLGEIATLIKRGRAPHYTDSGTLVVSRKCVREGNVFARNSPAAPTERLSQYLIGRFSTPEMCW